MSELNYEVVSSPYKDDLSKVVSRMREKGWRCLGPAGISVLGHRTDGHFWYQTMIKRMSELPQGGA